MSRNSIETKYKELHEPRPKGLKKELQSMLKRDFLGVVEQYGLKGGDELPDVLANRIIHELFTNYSRSTYLVWLEENWEEIDEDSPFSFIDLGKSLTELEKQYAKDGVTLDAEAWAHELKRGLHSALLESSTQLREIVVDDELVLDIQARGNLPTDEVVKRLKEELGHAKELVKQVGDAG